MMTPVVRVSVLAILSVGGIIGMLLADGAADWVFLLLAAVPLLLGAAAFAKWNMASGQSRLRRGNQEHEGDSGEGRLNKNSPPRRVL